MRHGQLVRKTSSVRKGKGPAFNRTSKVFPNPQLLEQPMGTVGDCPAWQPKVRHILVQIVFT
jgi:hypothetical protein